MLVSGSKIIEQSRTNTSATYHIREPLSSMIVVKRLLLLVLYLNCGRLVFSVVLSTRM
jgi:hypothetical protein